MERNHLEHIVRMYRLVQDIERLMTQGSRPSCSGDVRAHLQNLRMLARSAPGGLKDGYPSYNWAGLSRMSLRNDSETGRAVRNFVPQIKAAVLAEFGLKWGTLVYSGMTEASFAAVFDSEIDGRDARCLFLDGVLSSAEFRDGSPALLYPPLIMRSFGMLKSPRRGLVLGVAGGTMVEILKHEFPKIHVDGVDIDAEAVDLGRRFFSLKVDSRTALHMCDAREFVHKSKKKYDIAVMDAFAGISPIPHLATVEFAREMKSAMGKGGVCAINIIARLERTGYLQYAYDTWRSAFASVFVLPLCKEGELFNIVLIATDADSRAFKERNEGAIYPMDYDASRVFTDRDNRIRELSPY
ncbi:fused MFS/spermidine synthase [Candidatus Micrarchaeota archaeon]|nr:fused MFS/spermidine synthase [Candidatus Micrarchaeota archaeon]